MPLEMPVSQYDLHLLLGVDSDGLQILESARAEICLTAHRCGLNLHPARRLPTNDISSPVIDSHAEQVTRELTSVRISYLFHQF